MFRCENCGRPAKKPLILRTMRKVPTTKFIPHPVEEGRSIRVDGERSEIAQEVKLCPECHEGQSKGIPLAVLKRRANPEAAIPDFKNPNFIPLKT